MYHYQLYGALRAPTSNCVVLLAQGDLGHILEVAQQLQGLLVPARRISGDGRTEDERTTGILGV